MAESDDWAAPGGSPQPPPSAGSEAPPRYGERIPGWTPPAAQTPPLPPPTAPPIASQGGYVRPPKPGLFPLYPMPFGRMLGSAFAAIRWNPRATIGPALVVAVVQVAITDAVFFAFLPSAMDRIQRATDAGRGAIIAGTIGEGVLFWLLLAVVALFGGALLQGVIVGVVADGGLGRRSTLGSALRRVRPSILPLVGWAFLFGAAIVVAIGVVGVAVALLAALGGLLGAILAVVLGLVGLAGLGVLIAFVWVKTALSSSIIVLERRGIRAAIARSWRLTRGSFWRTFGVLALVGAIVAVAAQLVSAPFSFLGGALGGLLVPNGGAGAASTVDGGDVAQYLQSTLLVTIPSQIVATIVSGIGQIAQVAAVALVYIDARMRREGLDIELQRVVEQGSAADPYSPAPRS